MATTIQTIYGTLDEKQLKELKGAIEEINNYFNEIENRQKIIKEIIDLTCDNTKLPKKIVAKMAKVYHKQSFQQEVTENKEFESLFESITEVK
jgi:nucleotidyltransferase/DNA polymerase involved in DNA repair